LKECRLELEGDAETADHDVSDAEVCDEIVGDGTHASASQDHYNHEQIPDPSTTKHPHDKPPVCG